MLNFDVKRKINTLRDILVGKVPDPKAQVEQITIALIYKFMDDMDLESVEFGGTREFFKEDYEKYAWSKIMDTENSGSQRANLYADGIEKMTTNPHLPQLFRDIFRGAYIPYRDPETLNMFLKEVSDFNYDHSEELGNAFEYLLSIMGSQGDAGQFRTPRHIIDMMVEIVDPKKTDTILDPACGTAGFLISSYKHIREKNNDKNGNSTLSADDRKRMTENFAGYDISPDMVRLSRVNMYLHKFAKPKIYEYDTLTSLDRWDETYDVILANPPFMTPKGGIIPHNRYRVKAKRSEVLFVDYIAEHLNPNGKAAIIVPEGIVFQSANAYKLLRQFLVEDNLLYAVISLPAGVFNPYSGVKTSILLFDKAIAKQKDEILFVKIENDGYGLGAQRKEVNGSDISEAIKIINDYKEGKEILLSSIATLTKKVEIADQDYILVGDRYKKITKTSSDYPLTSLDEICDIFNGSTPSRNEISYWENGSVPWFTIDDIRTQGREISHTSQTITQKALKDTSVKLLPADTVLLCCTASVGEYAITNIPLTTNQQFNGLVIKDKYKNLLLPKFLFYMASNLNGELDRLGGQTSFKFVSIKNLKQIRIPLPPLHIQEDIIAEIEGYQKVLDGARQVVENYKPSFRVDPNWNFIKLGDISEINPKKSEVKCFPETTTVSFVPMAILNEHDMYFTPLETKNISDVYSGYTYFKENDVLLAKVTPCFENGKAGIAKNLKNDIGFGSSEFYVLRANSSKILPEMIYYYINSDTFIKNGKSQMTGTGGLRRLTKDYLENSLVPLPDIDTQKRIVSQINNEMEIVKQNKFLIQVYNQKIYDRISEIWGE